MHTLIRVLGFTLVVAVLGAVVEITHPKGLAGIWRDATAPSPIVKEAPAPVQGTGPAKPEEPPAPAVVFGPGAARELSWADRDYDHGDFDGAVSNYSAARVLAGNADERYRASQGLEKAVLAWALVRGSSRVDGKPADLEQQWASRVAKVEASPSEKGWVEVARWTAGAGLKEHLSYVVGQALDSARPGGFVQAFLDDAAKSSGPKAPWVAGAMAAKGLRAGTPITKTPVTSGADVASAPSASPTERSGIGAVNARVQIPFGRFSMETREKLKRAADLQARGTDAYEQATPDSPHRVEHRDQAVKYLKEARDLYLAAQAEDGDCRDLDERLRETLLMLAQLKKDMGIGDR